MTKLKWMSLLLVLVAVAFPITKAFSVDSTRASIRIHAHNKQERSAIANIGPAIDFVGDDFVIATATLAEQKELTQKGFKFAEETSFSALEFPTADREFHTYAEVTEVLENLSQEFPDLIEMKSIGKTLQGRDIWSLIISKNVATSNSKPAVLFLGGHHAREHLSVETPLRFVQWVINEHRSGNPRIEKILEGRQIRLIPMVNPDGLEYDIEGDRYKAWRKNRRQNANGTFGVDLNRNYSFHWGTGGSSNNPDSETFMGPTPFSEPETQAIKAYIETNTNISILLSFHTFSELILYPWGHSNDPIPNARDKAVHEVMARKMATWNHYTPEQTSDLYVASGDLTDWSYGQQKVISFTFELDPANSWGVGTGGFYPGAGVIMPVLQKNIEPCLYLLEYADNPYRVLDASFF